MEADVLDAKARARLSILWLPVQSCRRTSGHAGMVLTSNGLGMPVPPAAAMEDHWHDLSGPGRAVMPRSPGFKFTFAAIMIEVGRPGGPARRPGPAQDESRATRDSEERAKSGARKPSGIVPSQCPGH